MPLPFNLQKLPYEALDLLRFLGKNPGYHNTEALEKGSGMSSRVIGKAIRRLINYDYIQMGTGYTYALTTDGDIAVKQIAEHDLTAGDAVEVDTTPSVIRRLAVVLPHMLIAGRPTDLYFGVNAPSAQDMKLPGTTHVELRVTVLRGKISSGNVSLEIPAEKASPPAKLALTASEPGKRVRVRLDAYQSFDLDRVEPLGGFYFDARVALDPSKAEPGSRAVGMDLVLKPPRKG